MKKLQALAALTGIALVVTALYSLKGCGTDPAVLTVTIGTTPVGKITLGSGWNIWDHWWGRKIPRYRLAWNDEQWASYLGLLKESGADWVRLDFYYGNTEPRNDNDDPEVINWKAFTFDSPRLKSLYKHLDFFQANGINVNLTYHYLRSNQEYNLDRQNGWLSKEAVSKRFPELWTRPRDEPVDRRELAENMAATAYYLIKQRGYTCVKQLTLYVEPDNGSPDGGQWVNVDGYKDTVFLAKLLTKLGIRDQVKILNGDPKVNIPKAWPPELGDYDVFGIEDYEAEVDWSAPERGLGKVQPEYEILRSEMKTGKAPKEVAMTEYGPYWCRRATDPSCAYLKTLSSSAFVFQLYNWGLAGTLRWVYEPLFHPYFGFGVIKVQGISYPSATTDKDMDPDTNAAIFKAMSRGAKFSKVPYTFEPQRLVNANLRRGSTVYEVDVVDPTSPGKGVYAIAAKDAAGKWRVGLINLYPTPKRVEVVFPPDAKPDGLRWDYYNAPTELLVQIHDRLGSYMPDVEPFKFLFRAARFTVRKARQILGASSFPPQSFDGSLPQPANNTVSLTLTARSINFLSE